MDPSQRDHCIARICSGSVRCTAQDRRGRPVTVLVKKPTRDQSYVACEVYEQVYEEALSRELFTEEALMLFMMNNDFWDDERQALVDALPKQIEEFKVQLFKAGFKSNERKVVRAALATAKSKLSDVVQDRHAHDYLSCSGVANIAKSRYLLGCSLHFENGKPVFCGDDFWDQPSSILDATMSHYCKIRLDDSIYRELARTEPWRTIWSARKVEGSMFGTPACDYTEEQRAIVNWSLLYDNVFQHAECPPDSVVEDDDVFDGWMIDQRRKREEQQKKAGAEELVGNERIRNSQEVYLPAESVEDARKVNDLNDAHGKVVAKQRFNHLKKNQGVVNEVDMPDTKRRLRMAAVQMMSQAVKQS